MYLFMHYILLPACQTNLANVFPAVHNVYLVINITWQILSDQGNVFKIGLDKLKND
jgi:hypothetical protein